MLSSRFTPLLLAATISLVQASDSPVKIAYLAKGRFELQNSFLFKMLARLEERDPTFRFE